MTTQCGGRAGGGEYVRTPDGALLHVRQGGPVGAPPLLLLQGQANSMRWWERLRMQFERDYRTVTFDYRGTGGSKAHRDRLANAAPAAGDERGATGQLRHHASPRTRDRSTAVN